VFSFCHKSGRCPTVYHVDGHYWTGRTDFNLWEKPKLDYATGLIVGNQNIEFKKIWKIAAMDNNHLSISHRFRRGNNLWRSDGNKWPGNRGDWHAYGWAGIDRSDNPHQVGFGDRFVQIGQWRIADIDGNHMSIASGLTADIYRSDNTIHPGPRFDFNAFGRKLERHTDECIVYKNWITQGTCGDLPQGGNGFIQIGRWRIGTPDGVHFSFSHMSTRTSAIFRSDGTQHWGPRGDFQMWTEVGETTQKRELATNVKIGDNYIEFKSAWRLGVTPDGLHLSISHVETGKTAFIWRLDGTRHAGPRDDFGTQKNGQTPRGVFWSESMIRIGTFTIGEIDPNHMSISTTMTSDIYRSDGTVHPGPRLDWQGTQMWAKNAAIADKESCPARKSLVNKNSEPACDFFLKGGDGWVEVGNWRFGNVDGIVFSFGHKDGKTAAFYHSDGRVFNGPSDQYGLKHRQAFDKAINVEFGDDFIEFGKVWRLAVIDTNHMSISH
jgi:hypothetical protein